MPEFVVVTAVPHITAAIVKGALEAEGITVVLQRDGFGAIYGLDRGRHATEVRVPADQAEQARALLSEIERDLA